MSILVLFVFFTVHDGPKARGGIGGGQIYPRINFDGPRAVQDMSHDSGWGSTTDQIAATRSHGIGTMMTIFKGKREKINEASSMQISLI